MYLDALEFQQLEQTSLGSILGGDSIVSFRSGIVKAALRFLLWSFEPSIQHLVVT
jgi:hypothetical protein